MRGMLGYINRFRALGRDVKRKIINTLFIWHPVEFTCNACNRKIRYPLDSPNHPSLLFERDRVIGSSFRPKEQCPLCLSNDRLRFVVEVLHTYTDIRTAKCSVLEFSPIKGLAYDLKKNPDLTYLSGDIVPGRAMRVLDITKIDLPDNRFDYVIANHVLEHILDEEGAIREMMRVTRDGGTLSLTMPIDIDQPVTLEDPTVVTDAERRDAYGQADHVRLYALDTADRLRAYGLMVREIIADDSWRKEIDLYRLIPNDRVFLCTVNK